MNPPTVARLLIPRPVLAAMTAHAAAELPNECCGLLGGAAPADGVIRVSAAAPVVNAAASPVEYESEPRSILAAVKRFRAEGLEVVGVYHSHPTAPPVPSRADLARNYWGHVAHVIISLQSAQPEVRAWWLGEADYREADWDLVG